MHPGNDQQRGGRRFGSRTRHAVVVGRWGDDTVLLRLDDGDHVEAAVPDHLRKRFEVGDEAEVRYEGDRLAGWRLLRRA